MTPQNAAYLPALALREIILTSSRSGNLIMDFFNSAVDVLQTLVIALGAGLAIWGAINLLEGYGNDNPGAKSQGMKQLMAGGGVVLTSLQAKFILSQRPSGRVSSRRGSLQTTLIWTGEPFPDGTRS